MSGPKYYTINVNNGDAMEVYHRMSHFQRGVSVTVSGNKLVFQVTNDAWLQGVDRDYLQKQATTEAACSRRVRATASFLILPPPLLDVFNTPLIKIVVVLSPFF